MKEVKIIKAIRSDEKKHLNPKLALSIARSRGLNQMGYGSVAVVEPDYYIKIGDGKIKFTNEPRYQECGGW